MNEDEDRNVSSEEQALRDLMLGAVGGIKPSGDALERLRHAVPARRVRKRQTLVAAAAAALLVGTAVPAAFKLTGAQSGTTDHPAMAGHAQQGGKTEGGSSDPHQNGADATPPTPARSPGAEQSAGGATGAVPSPPADSLPGGADTGPTGGSVVLPGGSGFGVMLPPPAAPGVATCGAEQLGVSGSARPPEADGKVYGSFKVTNVSMRGCTVIGPDTLTAAPAAAPGSGKDASGAPAVTVVGHTTGDPATGLPDPSADAPLMLLAPNAAYEVRFAWVPPAQGCPAPAASTGSNAAGGSGDAAQGSGTGLRAGTGSGAEGGAGVAKEPETQPVPPADPVALSVSHTPGTPLPGAPTTQTTIPDACGGTVYRTGVIPLAEPQKP